jgi:hypothetical protein
MTEEKEKEGEVNGWKQKAEAKAREMEKTI